MIQKWVDENGNQDLPANLTKLASRTVIVVGNLVTPCRQDKQEKAKSLSHPLLLVALWKVPFLVFGLFSRARGPLKEVGVASP
jgi:hypothetical protein